MSHSATVNVVHSITIEKLDLSIFNSRCTTAKAQHKTINTLSCRKSEERLTLLQGRSRCCLIDTNTLIIISQDVIAIAHNNRSCS